MSGAVAMMLGAGVPRVNISGGFGANDSQFDPTPAFAGVAFESDGDVTETTTSGSADAGDWITPKSAAPGAYEISVHQDSGDALDGGSGALDTWVALSSGWSASITQTGLGTKAASLTASIRLGGVTLSSGNISLQAQVG